MPQISMKGKTKSFDYHIILLLLHHHQSSSPITKAFPSSAVRDLFVIIYGLNAHFMGGVEDNEPPSKRVKASSIELKGISNGLKETKTYSFGALMARPLASQGEDEIIGSKGIKKVEFVRVIAEALYSLGYSKTGACLEEESGIPFQSPAVSNFIQQILDGNWDESLASLHKIGIMDESIIKSASFIILQQKFFELLDREKLMEALKTLRTEISPLSINNNRVRELSFFILSPKFRITEVSGQRSAKPKARSELLEELQNLLPPTVMIPDRRMLQLVEQALDLQRGACLFHNSDGGETSLFTDHHCGRDQIPSQTIQILQEHQDEVWHLQFSQNGKYLASSSSDNSAIIWEVGLDGKLSLKHRLIGHQKPVSSISWSPADDQILTCGIEEVVRRWDVTSGECLHVYEKGLLGLVSCSWSPDGKSVLSGLTDKSIITWDLDGKEMECLKGQKTIRNSDLQLTSDGKLIITMCKETMILLIDRESKSERCIEEEQMIVSFTLSRDNKYVLVSLVNEELHLWSIESHIHVVAKYKGHKRSRFIVRACFGGLEQAFIASGSEDSQVYIWHRGSGELIETLEGHSGAVNCISWNPVNPHMLASASDDRSIRIWGLKQLHSKQKGKGKSTSNNGTIHYCNGATV